MSSSPFIRQFAVPTRTTVLALAGLSLATSVVSSYWVLPTTAFVLLLIGPRLKLLHEKASPRFIAVAAVVTCAAVLPRGTLSFASARDEAMAALMPSFRTASALIAVAGFAATGFAAWRLLRHGRLGTSGWSAIFIWVIGSALTAILVDPEPWIDVWHLHRDAGAALGAGVTPYDGRTIPNAMDWFPEGSVFEGYVYPPVVLYTYALSDLVLGDSRWVALVAGAVICIAARKLTRDQTSEALALLLVMTPGWPAMVQLSWTEPLCIALLAVAVSTVNRVGRHTLFGVLMASKQYLLMWAIPATVSWFNRRKTGLMITGLSCLVTYALGLVYGPNEYFEWVFVFHLTAPDATFGSGIPGLARMLFDQPVSIPGWLSLSLGVTVGTFMAATKPRTDGSMLLAGAAMLYVVFLTGSQAFPNYWYFILGAAALAVMTLRSEALESQAGDPDTATAGQVSMTPADQRRR